MHDKSNEVGPFKLICDGLQLANVLGNGNLKVTGVIDWESTYTSSSAFAYAPPSWLVFEQPEYWPGG